MNQITKLQKVIITRVGSFWVDRDRADAIDRIRENDPTAVIDIDDNRVQASSIYATLTPEQFQNYQNEKRGLWQCQYKNWHPKFDNCACARSMAPRPPEPRPEITDEQREKNRQKLAEMRANFKRGKNNDRGQQRVSDEVRVQQGTDDPGQAEVSDVAPDGGVQRDDKSDGGPGR